MITLSAIHIFKEKGIEKATVSDIVKHAGIAQGTFYLYFPSKLSVMPAIAEIIIDKTMEIVKEKVDVTAPVSEQLRQLMDIVFDYTKKYRDIYALIYTGMGANQQLNEWEAIYEPYYELVASFIELAQQKKQIRSQVCPKRTASILIGLFESAADQSYLYDKQNEAAIREKKKDVLEFALHALAAD